MKRLQCEMCGSTDLIKNDGLFVCQNCLTKYSPEEAKKMMVEVNLKIDNTETIQHYLHNARRAKQSGDWEETEKYYNLVEENDSRNLEAIFYSSYAKALASLSNFEIIYRQNAFNVVNNCICKIDEIYDFEREEEIKPVLEQISADIMALAQSKIFYLALNESAASMTLINNLGANFMRSLMRIGFKYAEDEGEKKKFFYELALKHSDHIIQHGCLTDPTILWNETLTYHTLLNQIDPSHEIPQEKPKKPKTGCYVATAVYGSYNCPNVWILRRYRDYSLAKTWYGRAFVHSYYAVSPACIKWFGHTEWFNRVFKKLLDVFVEKLQDRGYESTPYNDIRW